MPCGDSFFEDVNAFTQSHMTYMRAFKTPVASPATTTPSAGLGRGSFSGPSHGGEASPADRQRPGLLLSSNRASVGSKLFGSGEGSSRAPQPTSEESPIVLSQESSLGGVHEQGYCDFEQTGPIPILERTSFKKSAAPSTIGFQSPEVGQVSRDLFDDLADDFDDDDGDFGFDDVEMECATNQAQASAASSSTSTHQSPSVTGKIIRMYG